jgi:hypothetical protein
MKALYNQICVRVRFFLRLLLASAIWDAAKKSLDVAQKPVNLKLIRGIKALFGLSFKLLKDGETRYNWQVLSKISTDPENFSVTS